MAASISVALIQKKLLNQEGVAQNEHLHVCYIKLSKFEILSLTVDIDEEDEEDMMAYDCQREVLLFYKFYDPARRMIYYMGHSIEHIMSKFSK